MNNNCLESLAWDHCHCHCQSVTVTVFHFNEAISYPSYMYMYMYLPFGTAGIVHRLGLLWRSRRWWWWVIDDRSTHLVRVRGIVGDKRRWYDIMYMYVLLDKASMNVHTIVCNVPSPSRDSLRTRNSPSLYKFNDLTLLFDCIASWRCSLMSVFKRFDSLSLFYCFKRILEDGSFFFFTDFSLRISVWITL